MDIGALAGMSYAAAFAFSAIGSAFGTGTAGMAAIGAMKKCYVENREAPFMLVALVGLPLTQTIYGYILLLQIKDAPNVDPVAKLSTGVLAGIAIGLSAYFQGRACANGADSLGQTGKGLVLYIIVAGIIETVALFVMVFFMTTLQ